MKKITLHVSTLIALLIITVASLLVLAFQYVQAAFQKGVASGASIRITEANACIPTESKSDTPQFSGCNSII